MKTRKSTTKKQARGKARIQGLNEAALNKLGEHAGVLTEALFRSAMDGNQKSAAILQELSHDALEAKKEKPIRSLALRLAAEPQLVRESLTDPAASRKSIKA
jgi:hypothetical protein